jgi:hypothetical protein
LLGYQQDNKESGMPLYDTESPFSRGEKLLGLAGETTSRMDKKEPGAPPKTIGGGLMSGLGGAGVGAAITSGAAAGSVVPVWGTAIGAAVGLAAYYLS